MLPLLCPPSLCSRVPPAVPELTSFQRPNQTARNRQQSTRRPTAPCAQSVAASDGGPSAKEHGTDARRESPGFSRRCCDGSVVAQREDAANAAIAHPTPRCNSLTCSFTIALLDTLTPSIPTMSGFRSGPVKDRSSTPGGVSAAIMMASAAAGRPHDADVEIDDGDDSDVFVKDESSSPDPDCEKPRFVERRPPSKTSSGTRRIPSALTTAKSGKSASKAAASSSSKGGSRSPPSSPNPVIPRRAEDWEPWKTILHELYITQNRILRDIIVIMETNYNLRATPKMYKNQFARWNFFKYAIKRRPRNRSDRDLDDEREDDGRNEGALVTTSRSPDIFEGLISPLLHDSRRARVMQTGLASVRDFLKGYINLDPTAQNDMVVVGYQDPSFRYFTAAMDLFDQKENDQAGLLLRRAFLQIEQLLSTMTLKAFSDLCFTIPHLLLESHRPDILTAYLRYLSGLTTAKFPNHPIGAVISSYAELLDDPDAMMRYIMALSKANSDTISKVSDGKDRTRKWAHNQFVACQHTNLDIGADSSSPKHPHSMLRTESQSVYWAQHLIMADPESDKLAELWMYRNFPDDFVPRTEAFVAKVRTLGEAGHLPPEYARMMECLYIGWLNDYYETHENWPKVFEWARRGLLLSTGEQYQTWSIHLEELQRKHGSVEEADEMRKRRLGHEFLEKIRAEVEKMTLALD
ncbi:hypothetical protein B0T16DRAFT_409049 [Cercophora newfieldiana]|uniref:Clr5 domain-containing protein n=1 Tax=Cercophora newfieldiana TaxID=92897 RepID=A0AA39YA80_9PEZI|nr:hypothetical protein B0T16DRAFT_409049 [Cercophora newfieldiana]